MPPRATQKIIASLFPEPPRRLNITTDLRTTTPSTKIESGYHNRKCAQKPKHPLYS
jgi:hypothetical protein